MSARTKTWLMWALRGVGRLVLLGAAAGAAIEALRRDR